MKAKCINQNPRTLAIIFDSGDEVIAGLQKVAVEHKLAASCFTAIGAFEEVTLGFFELEEKDYQKMDFKEQLEVLSLIGDISLKDSQPQIHAHAVVGRADARINRAEVYVTNVVKHFKWEPKGKRRIHKKPGAREIAACRPWPDAELAVLKPKVLVCLGATAGAGVAGKNFSCEPAARTVCGLQSGQSGHGHRASLLNFTRAQR